MTAGFKYLEHVSDVYIEVFGATLAEAFEQAGLAVYDTMTDLVLIDEIVEKIITLESTNVKNLLYKYIDELIFIFDTEFLLFKRIKAAITEENGTYKLEVKLKGEPYSELKHKLKVGIKSATYSRMEIIETKKGILMRFIMDI